MGATTIALTALLYPYHGHSHHPAQEASIALTQPDENFGVQDFPHFQWRHAEQAASRSHKRTSLPSHHPEPKPSPSDIPQAGTNRGIGHQLLIRHGWGENQWSCLNALWGRESGWKTQASNSSSGAYGIPQALPGWKMESAGSDWRTNPMTQIRWGIGYIAGRYGTPCVALGHSNAYGYY